MERLSDYGLTDAVVSGIVPGSIAEDLGIGRGSRLLRLNGVPVSDVFDYRTREQDENILLLVADPSGELTEYEIEKDEDEDLGLEFENPLLSACESCSNHCLFCFIDQLPPGLRPSLYFKDDDTRLSFLTGNYVTLTNMSDEELDRIISYHFSPLNISVHSTDPPLRRRLLGNVRGDNLMPRLKKLAAAGIRLNAQFVLCPGLNDGPALERSLSDLFDLAAALDSIAVVPVGLTRWREYNKLVPLKGFTAETAAVVLDQVETWQQRFYESCGRRILYASDEFFLLCGREIPAPATYEGYPQLENGVGMVALFRQEVEEAFADGLEKLPASTSRDFFGSRAKGHALSTRVHIATGVLAAPVIREVKERFERASGMELKIHTIVNRFFGESITVAGLLTATDIALQLQEKIAENECLLLCDKMLRANEDVFLDNLSLGDLAERLGCPVTCCGEGGRDLLSALLAIRQNREREKSAV